MNDEVILTYTANSGIALSLDGVSIWIDALHNERLYGFSSLSCEQEREIFNGALGCPDILAFTHKHPDHYSEQLIEKARERWSVAEIYTPACLCGRDYAEFGTRGIKLCFFKLEHDNERFKSVEHYGICIRGKSRSVLISGDCSVGDERFCECAKREAADTAIVNFPWVTLKRGRDSLNADLRDCKIAIAHLPFEQDDYNGYVNATKKAVQEHFAGRDIRVLTEFLQTESL